jgi:hypothetical protein
MCGYWAAVTALRRVFEREPPAEVAVDRLPQRA